MRPPNGPALKGVYAPPNTPPLFWPPRKRPSAAPVVWLHRQFGLGVGRRFRRDGEKLAAAILNRGVLELVVLALVVELNAGADADIVGDVGGADGVGERLRVARAGGLVGIRRNQQRLEREGMIGVH